MLTRFFISFALILIIPLCASIYSYFYAKDQLENEILKSNSAALDQFYYQIEARFNTAYKIINQIDGESGNSFYKDHTNSSILTGYETYLNNKFLSRLRSDHIEDIFVYYIDSDKIVSAFNSTLPGRLYYETSYKGMNDYEYWEKMLTSKSVSSVVPVRNKDYTTLAVVQSLPLDNIKNSSTTAVCVLSSTYLANLLKSFADLTQGGIVIFDKNNNLVLSSDEFYSSINIKNENGIFNETINGKKFVIQTAKSEVTSCKYYLAMPVDHFWGKLDLFKTKSQINILVISLLGLMIAWLLSLRNYRPISKLLSSITNYTDKTYKKGTTTETDFIDDLFSNMFAEKTTLTQQLETMNNIEQKNFLINIIHGCYPEKLDLYKAFEISKINLLSNRFTIIICKIEDWDLDKIGDIYEEIPDSKNDLKSKSIAEIVIGNVLEELCSQKHKGIIFQTEKDTFVCLVNISTLDPTLKIDLESEIKSICLKAKQFFMNKMGICCSISYSNVHMGFDGIHRAYLQAIKALEYRMIYGKSSVLEYNLIENNKLDYNFDFRTVGENMLIRYIKTGTPDPSIVLDRIMSDCFNGSTPSPETMKIFIYDMNNIIRKAAASLSINDYFKSAKTSFNTLIQCETLSQYQDLLSYTFEELHDYYELNNTDEFSNRIIEYINKHYMNSELNINMIGYNFNISPSYCSKLFKKETGMSLLDCISKVRVEKAHLLLERTAMNIEDISTKVGFMSSTVFIRAYKKIKGITPGYYRKIFQSSDSINSL